MSEVIDRLGGDVEAAARSIALALAGILTEGGSLPEGATSRAEIVMSAVLAALRPGEQQACVA